MFDTEDKCIEYIHSLSKFGSKSGLGNIELILKRLNDPHKKLRFIHIAGTNGKGSVSNMINNILISHGYKVGYYTSPYIEFFSERICIDNRPIGGDKLMEYTRRVADVLGDIRPIEFEFITAMAMLYYYEEDCDIVVLETGLGGRLDSTNIIDAPLMSVITPIGYDHTAILGDTIEKIASEKAGIIKHGSLVVTSPDMHPDARRVIEDRCKETRCRLIVPDDTPEDVNFGLDYTSFRYKGIDCLLPLKGKYQLSNAVCAIEACLALGECLGINEADIAKGIKNCFWKCRFEIFQGNPMVVLDGAHNSHGIKALMESIELYFPNEKKIFVFSMLNEKDYKDSIDMMLRSADFIIATAVPSIRQTNAEDIYEEIKKRTPGCIYEPDPVKAYAYAIDKAKNDGGVVFVFGSLYLSGMIRKYVK